MIQLEWGGAILVRDEDEGRPDWPAATGQDTGKDRHRRGQGSVPERETLRRGDISRNKDTGSARKRPSMAVQLVGRKVVVLPYGNGGDGPSEGGESDTTRMVVEAIAGFIQLSVDEKIENSRNDHASRAEYTDWSQYLYLI